MNREQIEQEIVDTEQQAKELADALRLVLNVKE